MLLMTSIGLKFLLRVFHVYILKIIMTIIHYHVHATKKCLFEEAFNKMQASDLNPEILEIGVGTGENFRYFPKNTNLTILDKTESLKCKLQESIDKKERKDITITNLVVNRAEDMIDIKTSSMDAVVHTFVLCSVSDHGAVFREIDRVLKPGGICLFMEHAIDNKNLWRRVLQKVVQPITGDCCFYDMKKLLKKAPYNSEALIKESYPVLSRLLTFANPVVYGYGKKHSFS